MGILKSLEAKERERAGLMRELKNIAVLAEMGITRHRIRKSRPVTRYWEGKRYPTGKAEIVMDDGTVHFVPAGLLWTVESPAWTGLNIQPSTIPKESTPAQPVVRRPRAFESRKEVSNEKST